VRTTASVPVFITFFRVLILVVRSWPPKMGLSPSPSRPGPEGREPESKRSGSVMGDDASGVL